MGCRQAFSLADSVALSLEDREEETLGSLMSQYKDAVFVSSKKESMSQSHREEGLRVFMSFFFFFSWNSY